VYVFFLLVHRMLSLSLLYFTLPHTNIFAATSTTAATTSTFGTTNDNTNNKNNQHMRRQALAAKREAERLARETAHLHKMSGLAASSGDGEDAGAGADADADADDAVLWYECEYCAVFASRSYERAVRHEERCSRLQVGRY
jgi:hypothetical protein